MNGKEDLSHLKNLVYIYENVLNEINVGVQVINNEGNTIIYNQKKMQLESMQLEDVLNKNLLEIFSFKNRKDSRLLQALEHGTVTQNAKQTYFTNKGKEITTINNTYPIVKNGKTIAAVEIASDITKFERLKQNVLKGGNTRYTFESIIGESKAIKEVIENSKRATRTSSSVLIIGETGTGKELFSQSIHHGSDRSNKPFISQNCAALPDNLIESLLFGTKKGAFTGAIDHPGLLEQAEGGTILLDEINSLNPALQAKLLRAIQEKSIRRVGDTKDKDIDVRIIATINEDPIEAIANNRLRKDLYYRLSVVSLVIPPLRERVEDIPLLTQKFIEKYNYLFQLDVRKVSDTVYQLFLEYDWPGNIRELEHAIEGAMNLITNETEISYRHLSYHFLNKTRQGHSSIQSTSESSIKPEDLTVKLKDQMEQAEAEYIKNVLENNRNNITHTANILGISRQSLQYRLRKYNIKESL
ncbi:sigma 54-interacting transcriptional regulator [Anaerobacillus sp. CMMVII]|uniref:sigma-54 interaction domain-containing protein n=1 Tax=Anaerobacillus sp. CMMVII TaxID=2755588 RepID=UPI0021B7C08B|nr:sigma 54-interacting transcriptional regulator [Anaerobacillus sp. CMMVII]MCT8138766.1 sigma 54-interacting transcriptional regulator [Anaerobacillus sp. CMMVII]